MFRKSSLISSVPTAMFAISLLACPCGMLAQRGAAGGHAGGGAAGGGGLSGVGKPSGVDEKDDLKDFHAALAVQASSQQIIEYDLMLKNTAAASAELQAFREELGKENKGSALALASHGITLDDVAVNVALKQALEKARTENKRFLDGFSEQQKFGLKEISKRLIKADSDLAQQANALDQQVGDEKAVGPQIAGSVQSLERTLTNFRSEQLDLGQEMSIGPPSNRQNFALNIPPVRTSVNVANQPIAITTSGVITQDAKQAGQNTFALDLTVDMSDLQQNITEVLRGELDKSDRCGERIAIQTSALTPLPPASLVFMKLHYERWACFGGSTTNEMVEGNATVEVKLAPAVGDDGTLRLMPEMGRIDAERLVEELLRSGSLGDTLRGKIAEVILSTVRQGSDGKTMLPAAARGKVILHRAQFQGTGTGKLSVVLHGEIRAPSDKIAALTGETKAVETEILGPEANESKANESNPDESRTGESKTNATKGQPSSQETLPQ